MFPNFKDRQEIMCKIDAGIITRANRRTIENVRARVNDISLDVIVVSTEHMGKTYSQSITREQLNEAFGRSYEKIVKGGAQI